MAGELILIVEDDEKSWKLVRDILQAKGYRTLETESAEEGIRLAQVSLPALVIMDLQLPGISGIEARQRLRADPRTQGISVIAVTASAMTFSQPEIMAAGFDGYHSKPISVMKLLEMVRAVLDRSNRPR